MNIFLLDENIDRCVQSHVDAHVHKMCLEYAQMLCTANRVFGLDEGYKVAHLNHPCSKWVRESLYNWILLREIAIKLGEEHVYRFGTVHKSILMVKSLHVPPIENVGFTSPAQAMPVMYKRENFVDAYRAYYIGEKQHIARWSRREIPEWFMFGKNNGLVKSKERRW